MSSDSSSISRLPRRAFRLVFLTVFMDILGFSVMIPLYPKLLAHFLETESAGGVLLNALLRLAGALSGGTNDVFITSVLFGGIIGSVYSFLQFLSAPVWGRLSDKFGRRPVLLVTLAGTAGAYFLWMFSGSFWIFVASRMLAGVAGGNIAVAASAAADLTTGKERAGGMALVGSAFALGFLLGPAIGGFAAQWDWTAGAPAAGFAINPFSFPAFVAFVFAGVNWLMARFYFCETLPPERRVADENTAFRFSTVRFFRESSPGARQAVSMNFIFTMVFSGMEATLVFMTTELFGFGPRENAGVFVFSGIFLILAQGLIVRRLAPLLGERCLAIFGLAAGIAAFLAIGLTQSGAGSDKIMFFTGMMFFALSIGLVQPSLSSLVSLYSSAEEQGKNLGAFRGAGALARAIGPICAAFIYFKTHTHSWVYLSGALLALIPMWFALTLPRPKK